HRRRRPFHRAADSLSRVLRPRARDARGRNLACGPDAGAARRGARTLPMMERPLTANIRPGEPPLDLDGYERAGGYRTVRKALTEMSPDDVLEVVRASGLRGRGGAGF